MLGMRSWAWTWSRRINKACEPMFVVGLVLLGLLIYSCGGCTQVFVG